MTEAGKGLTGVKTADLKKALKGLHAGSLPTPLTIEGLTRHGLQHCAGDLMGALRGVDAVGLRAVLVCVLAERAERAEGRS